MHTNESEPLLRTPEAAALLGLKKPTLEKWRVQGGGPVYLRVGKKAIRYRRSDIEAFKDASIRHNTIDK